MDITSYKNTVLKASLATTLAAGISIMSAAPALYAEEQLPGEAPEDLSVIQYDDLSDEEKERMGILSDDEVQTADTYDRERPEMQNRERPKSQDMTEEEAAMLPTPSEGPTGDFSTEPVEPVGTGPDNAPDDNADESAGGSSGSASGDVSDNTSNESPDYSTGGGGGPDDTASDDGPDDPSDNSDGVTPTITNAIGEEVDPDTLADGEDINGEPIDNSDNERPAYNNDPSESDDEPASAEADESAEDSSDSILPSTGSGGLDIALIGGGLAVIAGAGWFLIRRMKA